MANLKHLEILKSGKEKWNEFIKANWKNNQPVRISPDLTYKLILDAEQKAIELNKSKRF